LQWFFTHHLVLEQKAQLGRQIHATRETVTMAALKLDYSVLDAPQRATDRIEADL
jgi:hypothetical protein